MSQEKWTAESSFVDFYNQVFRPSAAWHLSDYRLRVYDQAVARLVAHCGGKSPTLGEVTEELIDELIAAQLADRGRDWQESIRGVLRKTIRAYDPLAFRSDRAPAIEPGTLRAHFEDRYLPTRLTGAPSQTIVEYRMALRKFNEFIGRDLRKDEYDDAIMSDFFNELLELGRSAYTVNKYRAILFAVLRDAGVEPKVKKIRSPRNLPDAFTLPELKRIFAVARIFKPDRFYGPVPCSLWWPAALQVAYETGIRRGSLFAIRAHNISLMHGTLYVPGEHMKNRRGAGFQLSRGAVETLRRIYSQKRTLVFRTDLMCSKEAFAHKVERDFRLILLAAKVGRRRHRGRGRTNSLWHRIRRTTATHVAAVSGIGAAATLLGHSTEYVTERYIDRSQLPRRDATAALTDLSSCDRGDEGLPKLVTN